jgi:hypothetical protein
MTSHPPVGIAETLESLEGVGLVVEANNFKYVLGATTLGIMAQLRHAT